MNTAGSSLAGHSMIINSILLLAALSRRVDAATPLGREYWEDYGRQELEDAINNKENTKVAKNVILFIGDGMGPTTLTAARIYRAGPESFLAWEQFPHAAALKTYAEDILVTDSAASGTSLFTGVKTNYEIIGYSGEVKNGDCESAQKPGVKLTHITSLAQAAGKSTGIVTTARLTHATPATMYAHSPNRNWECRVPPNAVGCKDIGVQLIEDLPGKNINVLLGGGGYQLQHNLTVEDDNIDSFCRRMDGRDLIEEWADDKASRNLTYAVVNDTGSLKSAKLDDADYLLGVFSKNHLKFHHERDTSDQGSPALEQMTEAALKVLLKNDKGFLLMVEQEHIDLAHHLGTARRAFGEVLSLHDAINTTLKILEEAGVLDETLIIVTSDHSHTLSISGYPTRDSNILGLARTKDIHGVPYTPLMYANGRKANYHYSVVDGKVSRDDPSLVDTTAWDYHQQVAVETNKNTHGGHDVMLYAKGPYSHLFHHLHEQNYVTWVVKYAARLGEFSELKPDRSEPSSAHTSSLCSVLLLILVLIHNII